MPTKVIMPQMGESVVEGTVGKWLKREGDAIEQYEPIVEVETDKVTSEVTAVTGGTLLKIYVGEGQTVDAGTVLALIGEPGEAVPDAVESEVVAALGHAARSSEMAPAAAPHPHWNPPRRARLPRTSRRSWRASPPSTTSTSAGFRAPVTGARHQKGHPGLHRLPAGGS